MAHTKTSNGNYKGKRDKHETRDWTSDKKRKKPGWNDSGAPSHPSNSSKRKK
jgi:hypothetical protein